MRIDVNAQGKLFAAMARHGKRGIQLVIDAHGVMRSEFILGQDFGNDVVEALNLLVNTHIFESGGIRHSPILSPGRRSVLRRHRSRTHRSWWNKVKVHVLAAPGGGRFMTRRPFVCHSPTNAAEHGASASLPC